MYAKVLATACAFFSIASAATHNVTVGSGGLVFNPTFLSGITAGETILFRFTSSIPHSASESTFDSPCIARPQGKDSGTVTNTEYAYVLSDASSPVWFYCNVGSHCKSGMVFAVNPTASQTFDAFKAKAMGVSVPSGSLTSTSPHVSSTPGSGNSGVKTSVQKLTMGLAGVAFLVKLFL